MVTVVAGNRGIIRFGFFSAVSTQKFIREIEKKRRLDGTAADARSIYTCKLEVVTRVRKCWSGYRGSNNIAPEPA
jgi:hypothetical protein